MLFMAKKKASIQSASEMKAEILSFFAAAENPTMTSSGMSVANHH